jgi:O-antigen ligase
VITGTALIALLVVGLSLRFGDLLYTRLITDTFSSDMVGGSSGRLEFWSLGLGAMLNAPITLLTGFGWDVWNLMPFPRAPHNQYLNLYFHLGVIGLTCVTALLALLVREARAAIPFAPYTYKSVLMAFVIGLLAFATAAFFVDLYKPWMWCWAYAGLVMRMAVNIRAKASMVRPETKQPSAVLSPKDRFGWTGSAHRCAARRKAATTK